MTPPVVATRWGADPEFYGPRHLARLALLQGLVTRRVPAPARVLDVGCGAGRLVGYLADAGYEATGIEPSAEFVAYAREHTPGATFVTGPAAPLPFAAASFAAAIASEVLEHLEDDAAAVAELWRVLAPGGLLVVSVPADMAKWDASDDWAGHVRRYEPDRLLALLEAGGFTRVRVRRWGFPFGGLYHRLVFLRVLARKQARVNRPTPVAGPGRRALVRLVGLAFALDRVFLGAPWGQGLVAEAYKPA